MSTTLADGTLIDTRLACEVLYDYLVGDRSAELNEHRRFAVYAECNGFGDTTGANPNGRAWLLDYVEHGYDWSHVRDSSPEALSRALNRLVGFVGRRS